MSRGDVERLRAGNRFEDLVVRFYQYQNTLSEKTQGYLVKGPQALPLTEPEIERLGEEAAKRSNQIANRSSIGRKGYIDYLLWIDAEDNYAVIIEVKNTDWDRLNERGTVDRNLRRHVARVWAYLEGELRFETTGGQASLRFSDIERSAAIVYPRVPLTPGLRERIEQQLDNYGIQPIWFDEPPPPGDSLGRLAWDAMQEGRL